ncbi:MAG: universal stress protein [Candidatus Binatus sp.]|uniref:universal stress protein n=1 Tax=Candidatus Binatus sp. TaxID=2811406 RepID=UPI003C755B41
MTVANEALNGLLNHAPVLDSARDYICISFLFPRNFFCTALITRNGGGARRFPHGPNFAASNVYVVRFIDSVSACGRLLETAGLRLSKRDQMLQFERILCPVAFDPNSLVALRLASELAQERKATLYLLHVVAIPPGPEVALSFDKMEAAARTKLERLAREKVDGKARYEIEVMTGDPGVEVLQAATRLGANLIVMATHGRRGLGHFVLGSVTERVVREAPCPVLTVRPKAPAAKSSPTRRAKKRSA